MAWRSSWVGGFHAFRRTLASVIHESGRKSSRQLCDWMGHHDPGFTIRTYTGTLDDGVGEADFLDELIPVGEWATDGQHATRNEAQVGAPVHAPNPASSRGSR